jgi:hypothetical protein
VIPAIVVAGLVAPTEHFERVSVDFGELLAAIRLPPPEQARERIAVPDDEL